MREWCVIAMAYGIVWCPWLLGIVEPAGSGESQLHALSGVFGYALVVLLLAIAPTRDPDERVGDVIYRLLGLAAACSGLWVIF